MKRLTDVLQKNNPGYLTPLFWMHGEDESVLRHLIGKMNENGIDEFVVESRPHPDFLGEGWWHDVDIVLDEAKKRGMRVWFFDDNKYPSGYSAGKIRDNHPQYLKRYLREGHIDAVGPQQDSYIFVDAWLEDAEDALVSVVAARRTDGMDGFDYDSLIDLTDRVSDGILLWDIPEGDWRIFLFTSTRNGGEEHTRDYLNPLDPEPVQAFLHYVYQAHYDRYPEDFGKTIAGFFSDEPRFGSAPSYEAVLGYSNGCTDIKRPKIVLPWAESLPAKLNSRWNGDFKKVLPCLWYDGGDAASAVRHTFMDTVSALFGANYTQQIGDWCRAHKVRYIGHIIEENGAHTRLGYGAGHFFRAIRGQDYPGLDLIHQVWPGVTGGFYSSQVGYLDTDFFYWGITKMTASAAHIASPDSGTSMCEIFGAYGWQAGLKMMKWLTDHICVRGINLLVPHAFSPTACDWDAPPHFYDQGLNPQWRYFHIWSRYANRVCHLLSGGTHRATAAVLYHAEAEWAGKYMPFEKPVKALAVEQIDCDIVPVDTFVSDAMTIEKGCFRIGGETFYAMVVPYAQKLPEEMLCVLLKMAEANIPVFFMDALPQSSSIPTANTAQLLQQLQAHPGVKTCRCEELAQHIYALDLQEISLDAPQTFLRTYHYSQPDGEVYFITNEAVSQTINTAITLKATGVPLIYDALTNTFLCPDYSCDGQSVTVKMRLDAWQSRFVILFKNEASRDAFCEDLPQGAENFAPGSYDGQPLLLTLPSEGWTVSASKAPEVDQFTPQPAITTLGNVTAPGKLPYFTGTLRYETEFTLPEKVIGGSVYMDLGRVYETAEVWINEQNLGSRIVPPYSFCVEQYLKPGVNTIRVDVTNTLAKERGQNLLDRDMVQEPSGLIGPVRLFCQ